MVQAKGLAYSFSEKWFGKPTRLVQNPVTNSVGATPTLLLPNNPERVGWLIMNRSIADIAISFLPTPVLTDDWLITNSGGYVSMNVQEDGEAVTQAVYAIGPAAGNTVYVVEVMGK